MVSPVFPAVDYTRLLPPVDTANTDQVRGLVPQAPPNAGVDETFQNQLYSRPFNQVLSVNTFGERNVPTREEANPPQGENPNFIRPFGSILTANTSVPRGIELQVQPSIRQEIVDEAELRNTLFVQEAQQGQTQSFGLVEPPVGSQPLNFLSRPNVLEVSGFDGGDRLDPRDRSGNPDLISDTDTRVDSRFFEFLFNQEVLQENRALSRVDDRTVGSQATPERAAANETFVDFEALLDRTDVNARLGTTPGEPNQQILAQLNPGTPIDGFEQPAEREFDLNNNIIDREPIFAFERNLIEQRNEPVPTVADLNRQGALEPAVPNADQQFQADLRERAADPEARVSEQESPVAETERYQNPITGLVDGAFPLIGSVATRVA